ncbi:GDSL-type esterase/lipase family protein [Prochlorothrix hollandica]|uniref:G-D-S-L family lipolytic protein n=1 Tax=Prochlorothrix hollandica PCC 9006 = CALU 1027 TaxID=317619 RepID=A0A0M2Q4H8_PROHO|nr:GDSL-type esterase/lipase family protein [Prochlorothrix hollandica]KKJ01482.1 G-D-S-L family lipolytic protein [Prochlorothrix hollandica PCC 9006 = CALU 1027]
MQTLVRPEHFPALDSLQFQTPTPALIPSALRIVALGDSLVYGYGDPEGGGWVERLRRSWMDPSQPGHALYNLGIRGDGVNQVLQRLDGEFRNRGELKNRMPDRILLAVGLNDSARLGKSDGRNFTDFSTFSLALETLLDKAQDYCPVCFVGMVPTDPDKMPFLDCLYYSSLDQYRYKEATRIACDRRQIPYLDLFDLWLARGEAWWKRRLSSDGLHPNSLGYAAILDDVKTWGALPQFLA